MRKLLSCLVGLCCLYQTAISQTLDISGKVSDDKGNPLLGATIIEKNSKKGTTSDANGLFKLSSKPGTVLVISSIGFDSKQVVVSEKTTSVTVNLNAINQALSEVVVTGVGTATSKKRLAISVESISADKLPPTPGGSIDQALAGKIAGAQITSSSGSPGKPVSIQLRGINTIGGGTQPMILVDGVEMGSSSLSALDLNTVERVEVVQGASAATVYGAQGANGVIQIFTKKGKAGTAKIDLSSRASWDSYINIGKVHQPLNHSFQTNAAGDVTQGGGADLLSKDVNGIWGKPIWLATPSDLNNKPYKDNTTYYDHIKQLFNTAQTTNHNIYVSGGKEKSDYAIGVSQLRQESITDGVLKRTNLTMNYGFELLKNLKVRAISQLVYTDNTTGNENISDALYTYPFADFTFKDPDGNSPKRFGSGAGANSNNPYYYRQYRKYGDKQVDVIPSLNVNYKFPKFLELDYKYGINMNRDDYTRTDANQSQNKSSDLYGFFIGNTIDGTINNTIYKRINQNSLATALLKLDLANDFGLKKIPITSTTTAVYDWRQVDYNYTDLQYTGLPLYPANANQANTKSVLSVYEDKSVTYGIFVNEKLEWEDKGGVSAGIRSDFSSRFGSGQSSQKFPRGDAYIRPSAFGFWTNSSVAAVIPEFKLRAAYGEAGIQPAGAFDRIVSLNNGIVDNGPIFYNPARLSNPLLTVERSKELEFGTDFQIKPSKSSWFSNINLNATYWTRKGKNVIWVTPLPISSGASEIRTNAVDLSSHGFQFSIDASVYNTKNITWNLLTTFGTSKSFTDDIRGTPDIPLVYSSAATYTLRPGEQFGTVYGYKALRSIDQKDPTGAFYLDQSLAKNYEIVDGRVVETASRKVQFTPDKSVLGNTTPKFNMSFTNTINFKGYLVLSFQFDWYAKALQYNQTKEWMYSEGLHGDYDKPVTIGGVSGAYTAYYKSFYDASESNGTKDFFLENSSFLRLRNLSLSFDLAKFMKIPYTNRLQLVFSGRNIWTVTKYTGMDPEANENTANGGSVNTTQTSVQRGLDYFSFPNTKSYQIGINIGLN